MHLGRSWSKPERPIRPSPFSSSVAEARQGRREKRGRRGRREPRRPGKREPPACRARAGPMATNAEAGVSIPVSCLSPCHGFNGVVSQFQTSVHYTEYLANVVVRDAGDRVDRARGRVRQLPRDRRAPAARQPATSSRATTAASPTSRAASCSTAIRSTGALSSANYAGTATVAEVYCTTCHAVTNANDPHKTGIPWTPGSFPLQVAEDAGTLFVEKSPRTHRRDGDERGQLRSRRHVHVVPPVARRRHELHRCRRQQDHERVLGPPRGTAGGSLHGRGRLPLQGPEPTASPLTSRSSRASTATWSP